MRTVAPLLLATAMSLAIPDVSARAVATPHPVQAIGAVQGKRDRSPLVGQVVTVRGQVIADTRQGLGGVFLQDGGDGDPATSDGLFVQLGDEQVLASGEWWQVTGTVEERPAGKGEQTLTTLVAESVVKAQAPASGSPTLTVLDALPADWEALEGMQVRIDAPLTLAGQHQLKRYGELIVAFDGRLWEPQELAAPGSAEYAAVQAENSRRTLFLDDASTRRDPARVSYLPDGAVLRSGMVFTGVQGIVDQRNAAGYRLQVTQPLVVPALERPAAPVVPGRLKVAAFNLENLFNGDGAGGGFPTERGAASPALLAKQMAKLVAAIEGLNPDVAALMELENDGYGPASSLAQLVDALNATGAGKGDWRFVDAGQGPGDNPIRLAIIYRASRVSPVGKAAVLEEGPFGERSRVPLAQAFKPAKGKPFVVVANHFKSKGCRDATGEDASQNEGEGCWNATRVESAQLLHQWLQRDPTGTGTAAAVLLGDFNAYAMEAPIRQLARDGWRDAFAVAGVERPYSYVYDGRSGRLDHALLNPAMATRLRGAAEWHINADESDTQGYADGNAPGPWRSSDHDPLLLGFDG